jgi:hypothetical protein
MTTVSPSAMVWWISKRGSENPRFSIPMAWIMPSRPGGAPGGGSWLTQSGWITALKPSMSPLGRISSKVRRAIALRSSAMTGSFLAVSGSRRLPSARSS